MPLSRWLASTVFMCRSWLTCSTSSRSRAKKLSWSTVMAMGADRAPAVLAADGVGWLVRRAGLDDALAPVLGGRAGACC